MCAVIFKQVLKWAPLITHVLLKADTLTHQHAWCYFVTRQPFVTSITRRWSLKRHRPVSTSSRCLIFQYRAMWQTLRDGKSSSAVTVRHTATSAPFYRFVVLVRIIKIINYTQNLLESFVKLFRKNLNKY